MSNTLQMLLEAKLDEIYDPTLAASEYSKNYMKRLHMPKFYDEESNDENFIEIDSMEVSPEDFYAEFKKIVHEMDESIDLDFPDDNETYELEPEVAKAILAHATPEEIEYAVQSYQEFVYLVNRIMQYIDFSGDSEE